MTVVLDSSGWIELLADAGRAHFFAPALEAERLLVPSMVRYEVLRYTLRYGGESFAGLADRALAKFTDVPLDGGLAAAASRIAHARGLAAADAIIYASALREAAELWTQDAHFCGLPGVNHIPK